MFPLKLYNSSMSENNEHIRIGLIVKAHGVRGEVLVKPLTNDSKRFTLLKQVIIDRQEASDKNAYNKDVYDGGAYDKDAYGIEYVRFLKDRLLVKFAECNSANDAMNLKGCYIAILKKDLVKLPNDSYFVFDILGCEVVNVSGDVLGCVSDVLQTGSNDVYVVSPCDGKPSDILIPAIKSVVKEVLISEKRILVNFTSEGDVV